VREERNPPSQEPLDEVRVNSFASSEAGASQQIVARHIVDWGSTLRSSHWLRVLLPYSTRKYCVASRSDGEATAVRSGPRKEYAWRRECGLQVKVLGSPYGYCSQAKPESNSAEGFTHV
jgi:hypothetical protein